jgi:predicted nucleotide-binding protein (sugar kinase/HSP70/actin superfamily)
MNAPHDLEAHLREFARAEAQRLGLSEPTHYVEQIHSNESFTAADVPHTTLWVSGLSLAHDQLVVKGLRGIGYQVQMLGVPDQTSLAFGKEFGNKSQCNPTWFTVGNLVKHLVKMRDEQGQSTEEIIRNNVFITAGACGPCRFGMYTTEYRKALRDSGFDGFRVVLFQPGGGLAQATGVEVGLKIDRKFAFALVGGLLAGDVINLLGYRMRPYEVEPGSVNRAIDEAKRLVGEALERGGSVVAALVRARKQLSLVALDRSRVKPRVSVIGEFWAMTTEGDGNYHLYEFLEQQGAECDIQPLTNWLLYLMWEKRWDLDERVGLKGTDGGKYGLEGVNPTVRWAAMLVGETALRGIFQLYANALGLEGHVLPDMNEIAELAHGHYDNSLRGGEGHLEVGKLLHFVKDHHNHMTISVKPFGCMPSSGVSDGVQSKVLGQYPEAIFLPIETTGDGQVNVHSRVLMMLHKAREKAKAEHEKALAARGIDAATFRDKLKRSRYGRNPLRWPRHRAAGTATNLVYAV